MLLLKGHGSGSPASSVAFSPDGARLASCGGDTVRLWDLGSGQGEVLVRQRSPHSVAFSPDGRTLAWSAYDSITLQDLAGGQADQLRAFAWKIIYSPDGRLLAGRGMEIYLWDAASRRLLPRPPRYLTGSGGLAFSPDSRTLAVGRVRVATAAAREALWVELWDLDSEAPPAVLPDRSGWVTALAFSPDGCLLAALCGPWLCVWELPGGQTRWQRRLGRKHFHAVAFSPDGRLLAAGHNDGTVRFYETVTWRECAALDGGVGRVLDVAFAPDGMRLAAAGRKGKIVVWDIDF